MEPTPIPETSYEALGAGGHRSAWGTWFETSKPYSVMNSTYEVPSDCARLLHRACITWSMYIIPVPIWIRFVCAACHVSQRSGSPSGYEPSASLESCSSERQLTGL